MQNQIFMRQIPKDWLDLLKCLQSKTWTSPIAIQHFTAVWQYQGEGSLIKNKADITVLGAPSILKEIIPEISSPTLLPPKSLQTLQRGDSGRSK